MVNMVFHGCVVFLLDLAQALGISYEAVNVWIFCVIGPLVMLGMLVLVRHQQQEIKKLRGLLKRWEFDGKK